VALLALAGGAGALGVPFRERLRSGPLYPIVLATLLLAGPLMACAAGWAAVLGASVAAPRAFPPRGRVRFGRRLGRVTLAAGAGTAAVTLAGGFPGEALAAGTLALPVAAHALAWAVARVALVAASARALGRRVRPARAAAVLARALPGSIVGGTVGWAAAAALTVPSSRPLAAAVGALAAALAVHRNHSRALAVARRRERIERETRRAVARSLARLMEERDPSTQDHLTRVHRLAMAVGRRLELSESQLEALGAAALLHDIGKVSVPESVLNKPGKLTPEEMERVRRHSTVGAEIVEALPFPHSLAPAIRHHHERWDGAGYPDALEGEAIPMGARILAVVDCYDALTSERPYRRALAHREARDFLDREAGRMFDPGVVDALLGHLEIRGTEAETDRPRPAMAPAEAEAEAEADGPVAGSLVAAQRELETLYDISRAMGYGLGLEEFLTLVGCRLATLVPYQCLVVYFADAEAGLLRAHFAMGRAAGKLRLMTLPIGERLSGWAALQQRAAIGRDHVSQLDRDGTRSDLEEWEGDPEVSGLKSAIAAPMIAEPGLVGVLTLYDDATRTFSADDRRVLVRVAGYIAQVAACEDRGTPVRHTSLTDPLTGVPNARFLWLESAHRMGSPEEGFGLAAFRVRGLETIGERHGNESVDRALCELAHRFAAGARPGETLVRFGPDLFVVLTAAHDAGELVRRWHELAAEVERPIIGPLGEHRVRLNAAHASFPTDGTTLEALLEVLDGRLAMASGPGRTVLPFRAPQPTAIASDVGS
jgi:putative nucleotidyltransferase with HDIG domain